MPFENMKSIKHLIGDWELAKQFCRDGAESKQGHHLKSKFMIRLLEIADADNDERTMVEMLDHLCSFPQNDIERLGSIANSKNPCKRFD